MANRHNLYVIAGPNGAGKTTFAREFLPHFAKCQEFVNADLIAGGLSPFSAAAAAIEAGRIMLKRIKELASQRCGFAFETTLSGRGYLSQFRKLKRRNYSIQLLYLWLPNVELAVQRVRDRVRQGGHDVPESDIRRRFDRGLKNLFSEYRPLLDTWTILDNSGARPELIAHEHQGRLQIIDAGLFLEIEQSLELP
ncbi:MAG: zeta toxin family protein [Elusimicrobia bacterium]|nr:zeta toxin family protein [Elusimicrobiota bacterium]